MNSSLLKNFQINKENGTISLDYDQATPLDINIYISYLIGRISATETLDRNFYRVGDKRHNRDYCLVNDGVMGQTVVVPDYFHDHTEAFLLLTHRNIIITNAVSEENNRFYLGAKMNVENGVVQQNPEYLDCNMQSVYILKAGLLTLAKCIEKEQPEKLQDLFEVYSQNNQL